MCLDFTQVMTEHARQSAYMMYRAYMLAKLGPPHGLTRLLAGMVASDGLELRMANPKP